MDILLSDYGKLLSSIDTWFGRCLTAAPRIACRTGCSGCCRGLFDITLLDACHLKRGFDRLPAVTRAEVLQKVHARLAALRLQWPEWGPPYLLNIRPDADWEALMPDADETPCPLLAADGSCLVYDWRPMTCRLHGIPLIDLSGEVMHDEWCTENFSGCDPLALPELRWEFIRLFREEVHLGRLFTKGVLGEVVAELDTFIPTALLLDFEGFDWLGWWQVNGDTVRAAARLNGEEQG